MLSARVNEVKSFTTRSALPKYKASTVASEILSSAHEDLEA